MAPASPSRNFPDIALLSSAAENNAARQRGGGGGGEEGAAVAGAGANCVTNICVECVDEGDMERICKSLERILLPEEE
ncbi:hypothetical protein TREES_T100021624 [Tupaia chinensis]|uniref:Uncharacterized protein n=1 Tax=Tupaia chinensis TaxID=246437 RepID=L9JVM3_TUPCH|nr:hypothetical protein TREES_T100021624 [Tupaia chinensis]